MSSLDSQKKKEKGNFQNLE